MRWDASSLLSVIQWIIWSASKRKHVWDKRGQYKNSPFGKCFRDLSSLTLRQECMLLWLNQANKRSWQKIVKTCIENVLKTTHQEKGNGKEICYQHLRWSIQNRCQNHFQNQCESYEYYLKFVAERHIQENLVYFENTRHETEYGRSGDR